MFEKGKNFDQELNVVAALTGLDVKPNYFNNFYRGCVASSDYQKALDAGPIGRKDSTTEKPQVKKPRVQKPGKVPEAIRSGLLLQVLVPYVAEDEDILYDDLQQCLRDWLSKSQGVSTVTEAKAWKERLGHFDSRLVDALYDQIERKYDTEVDECTPDEQYAVQGITQRKAGRQAELLGAAYRIADVSMGDAESLRVFCCTCEKQFRLDRSPLFTMDDGRYVIKELACRGCGRKRRHKPLNPKMRTVRRDDLQRKYYTKNPDAAGAAAWRISHEKELARYKNIRARKNGAA